jgi:hypothetical protein
MSLQSAPVVRSENHVFAQLPEVIVTSIFEYLKGGKSSISQPSPIDDRTLIATASVCKNWRNSPLLSEARKEAAPRLHQFIEILEKAYPQEMVNLFRNSGTPLSQLPVLDLGDRAGNTGYINYIQPEEMAQPVMRFRDCVQRPGVALKIQASASVLRRYERFKRSSNRREGQSLEIVLAIFKRYADPESKTWSFEWGGNNSTIQLLYQDRHEENGHVGPKIEACPTCPFVNAVVNKTVLLDLLNGQDPDFSLPGHKKVVHLRNQAVARSGRGLSIRGAIATALVVAVIAYLVRYYFVSERSSI